MPSLIQHAGPTSIPYGSSSGTISFASNITAGNGIIVTTAGFGLGSPTVGTVDTFSHVSTYGGAAGAYVYYALSSIGGYKNIIVSAGETDGVTMYAYEVSKLYYLDKWNGNNTTSGGTAWTSDNITTLTASDFITGMCASGNQSGGTGITGPSSPWINGTVSTSVNGFYSIGGYQIVSSTGTFAYAGVEPTGTNYYAAIIAAFSFNPYPPIGNSLFALQSVSRAAYY
jgi:hypothetical protein